MLGLVVLLAGLIGWVVALPRLSPSVATEREVQRLLRQARRPDEMSGPRRVLVNVLRMLPQPFARLARSLEPRYDWEFDIPEQLAALGEPAAPALLKALQRHPHPSARAAAALEAHLTDRDQYAQLAVACALGLLGRTNGLEVIRANLTAEDAWRRLAAVLGLMRLSGPEVSGLLTNRLEDPAPAIRTVAAGALAGQGPQALAATLTDRDDDFQHYAARALVFFNDPATAPAVRQATYDSSPTVRTAARLALRRLERLQQARR